jgi:hypothetical protein
MREEEVERIEGLEAWDDHIERYTEASRRSLAKCFRMPERDGEGEGVEFKGHRHRLRLRPTAMFLMILLAGHAVVSQKAVHETSVKAPTLVDMSTPECTADEIRKITSRIDPRLALRVD